MRTHAKLWADMGKEATYQDILDLPAHMVGQILAGELIASPRPSGEHGLAALGVAHLVGPFHFGPGGGWWILPEPECHLGEDVVVPDVAGWHRERISRPFGPYFKVAPDWACEILSPSTASLDRTRKMRIYARERVGHVWLIDPKAQTLEAFRLEQDLWLRFGAWSGEERCRVEPFAEVELDLSTLWPAS